MKLYGFSSTASEVTIKVLEPIEEVFCVVPMAKGARDRALYIIRALELADVVSELARRTETGL